MSSNFANTTNTKDQWPFTQMLNDGRKEDQKEVSHIQNILFGKDTFIAICLVSITRLVGFPNYLTSQEVRNSDWFSLGILFSWSQNRQLGLTQIHWVWCLGFFFVCVQFIIRSTSYSHSEQEKFQISKVGMGNESNSLLLEDRTCL